MTLALCLPYYRNAGMLAEQYRTWAAYPDALKAALEVVLVDDGSPEPAADVVRPAGLPALRIFRVLEDRPWHQHGARNLAAHVAAAPWLFLTDMDHVLPAASAARLVERLEHADPAAVFTFRRLDAPDLKPKLKAGHPHPHVNTFAIARAKYWAIGGYDEDCVGYGTDGYFRRRLYADRPATLLEDVPIVRFPREVIPDASTRAPEGVDPKAFRDAGRRSLETKRALLVKHRRGQGPKVLAFPWEQVA